MKANLKLLQDILKNEKSARELAKLARCSIPTVYRRIDALKEAGAIIAETKVPSNKTGPIPLRFRVVTAAP